jgi:hypothetical protein
MDRANRARTAETPKQPSLGLKLRAPYLYPDRAYSAAPPTPDVALLAQIDVKGRQQQTTVDFALCSCGPIPGFSCADLREQSWSKLLRQITHPFELFLAGVESIDIHVLTGRQGGVTNN